MQKMSYKALVALNMAKRGVGPGDSVSLALRNTSGQESMFCQAQRLSNMFVMCYSFYPSEIGVHPEHLTIIKKQGKTLDVVIHDEQTAKMLGELLELPQLPTRIQLVADDTLDLWTSVARFHFREEDTADLLIEMLRYKLGD